MIKAILILNNHGKVRLMRFYQKLDIEKEELIKQLFQQISSRPEHSSNFLPSSLFGPDFKIIYRVYATLYIVFVVDSAESELGTLDLIQVFVEVLDRVYGNVCELDIIFHPDKAYYILDEIVIGGMVQETNAIEIWQQVENYEKLAKDS